MTIKFMAGAGVLALIAGSATAGGLDRSGQSVGAIFAPDNTVTSSVGIVMPSVTGSDSSGSGTGSYDVGETYSQTSLAFTNSANEKFNYSVIFDQPFGADISYGDNPSTSNLGGTSAHLNTAAVNFVGRYKISDRFSVFAGISAQRVNASVSLNGMAYAASFAPGLTTQRVAANNGIADPRVLGAALQGDVAAQTALTTAGQNVAALGAEYAATLPAVQAGFGAAGGYQFSMENTTRPNYLIGAAYEIPDIAMRIAGTYRFETTHTANISESFMGTSAGTSSVDFVTPASFNLEAQTGIAAGTLLTFGYRWTNWSAVDIIPAALGSDLVNLDDSHRYSLGVARRFSDKLAGSVSMSYEPKGDNLVSPLGPTNGLFGVSVGGQYTDGAMKVSGGLNYTKVGDAIAEVGGTGVTAFTDNHVIGVGLKVEFTF